MDDSSSQVSKSLQRQDTSDTSVDLNIFNDEMRLRNNFENMYKKGKKATNKTVKLITFTNNKSIWKTKSREKQKFSPAAVYILYGICL